MLDPIQRAVAAPAKEWLTEGEVLIALGEISSRTLDRYIATGRFPRPVNWSGAARWQWSDVAWYWLGKTMANRLVVAEDDEETPPERPEGAKKRQPAERP